jgi:phospholipid/cholesterol/gamma-HCH transport system substrate-binding protein
MAQRRSLAWTELRVGILVITSFALLALAIFFISGESGFLTPKYTVLAYFQNANNLRSGAEVQLEGVTVGNVNSVRISKSSDPEKAVEAELRLDKQYQNIIRTDSKVTIKTIGLLGDSAVDITRGTEAGGVVPEGGEIQGSEEGDIRKIVQGTNDFIANLQVLSDVFKRMAERVDRGEGTIGKFLSDSSIYDNADLTVREATALVRDAHTGRGTVGRLISDDELYQKVNATMERVNVMVAKIESGEGTAGKFINDPALYNKADQLVAQFQTVAERIERGEGTLGKLSKDDAFYNEARQTMARVSALVSSVENGEGTAGKFIKDPTFYNSINQTSSEVLKLLYDFRQNPKKYLTINFRLF